MNNFKLCDELLEAKKQQHLLGHLSHKIPVSVVIASLGDLIVWQTIEFINSCDLVPDEILICVPKEVEISIHSRKFDNVNVVYTPFKGQVSQRAFGLKIARNEYILQMDDDVLVLNDTIKNLYEAIKSKGRGFAIAPLYRDRANGRSLKTYKFGMKEVFSNIIATLICKAPWGIKRMGCVSIAGVAYGIDSDSSFVELYHVVDWLPGGCIICHKVDLVIDDYYPYPGKAYCEDLIHSQIWRKRNVSLLVFRNATCYIETLPEIFSLPAILADYRARIYFVKSINGSVFRCAIWSLLNVILQLLYRVKFRNGSAKVNI